MMYANCHEIWESEHSAPRRTVTGPYKSLDEVPSVIDRYVAVFNMTHAEPGHQRTVNEQKVISALRAQSGLTRPQIAKITFISTVTIGQILDQLVKDDLVTVLPPLVKRGQPTSRYELKGE